MSDIVTLTRVTHAVGKLENAFQFGESVERPGIIDAAHTATWHMAWMIELLRSLREDQIAQFRREQRGELPERPAGSEETSG